MLYEFKSRATGTVIMTEEVGRLMLEAMGREPAKAGAITVAQLPDAIAALRKASQEAAPPADDGDDDHDDGEHIAFARRALPLIEMFEASLQAGKDVSWGV